MAEKPSKARVATGFTDAAPDDGSHIATDQHLDELRRQNVELSRLTTHHASLEDVFVSLTGRHLRDD